jgi:hypothetical protein
MADFDFTHLALAIAAVLALALAASAAHERIASPATVRRLAILATAVIYFAAPAAAAIVVTGLVTLGMLGAPVTPADEGRADGARMTAANTATVAAVPPTERPAERFVELDNGRGVVVFREINGVLTSRLRLYRAAA